MSKETLDIIDTVVKVGLGAMVGGVTTYCLTRLKHAEERSKEQRRHKWEFLKDAVDAVSAYTLALGHFFAALDGLRSEHPAAKTLEETGASDFVEKRDQALIEAVSQRVRAFSRLRVIGNEKAADIIKELNLLEDEMRSTVFFKHELPSVEKLNSWYQQLRAKRDALLSELGQNL